MHTTNYTDTFIAVAEDCPASEGTVPPPRKTPSIATLTFEALSEKPYGKTSDQALFGVFAQRKGVSDQELEAARAAFFSRGQPCLRASDLGKRYGWGTHHDSEGRVALIGRETAAYQKLLEGVAPDGSAVTVIRAMRNKRR